MSEQADNESEAKAARGRAALQRAAPESSCEALECAASPQRFAVGSEGGGDADGESETKAAQSWPHAPPHHFTPGGLYMLTAGTLHKARLFDTPGKLDLLRDTVFELSAAYHLKLQAWAFLSNHYHLVASFEAATVAHGVFLRHLPREIAIRLNVLDGLPGRKVMYQFWDTHLTFEKSWLARLNYVHQNPVHHGLVAVARDYPWCSARWFESNASTAFVKSVGTFKTDRVNVVDDFDEPVAHQSGAGMRRTPKLRENE